MGRTRSYPLFRVIKFLTWVFYPKTKVVGAENLPDGPAIVVGNHAEMHSPIVCELYFPGKHEIWTVGEVMHKKEVQPYIYKDFWSNKPKYIRWFFKGLSYVLPPLSVCIFNNANCIGVYHDSRIMTTLRESVAAMREGKKIIILPEEDKARNNIICEFQSGYVDLARLYCRQTKAEEIAFVPMYTAPKLKKVYFGKPVTFHASAPFSEERERINNAMMDAVTEMARELPEHTVLPYPNLQRKQYPTNKMTDVAFDKTRGVFKLGTDDTDTSGEDPA